MRRPSRSPWVRMVCPVPPPVSRCDGSTRPGVGGVITPPCGVPATVRSRTPSTITPACSHLRSSLSIRRSETRLPTNSSSRSWSISPKKLAMSNSTTNW
jgi:hypothetical protein